MTYGYSTFKSSNLTKNLDDKNACVVVEDLNSQTSTFGLKYLDNCEEYYDFLDELEKIHAKVDSGDLSDFTE